MTRALLLRAAASLCLALLLALPSTRAQAALNLCNRTSFVLYAATGEISAPNVTTRGWTRIVPGGCARAIARPLAASGAYVYARTSQAHRGPAHSWGGQAAMCVEDTDFSLQMSAGASRCPSDDAFAVPFAQLATKGEASWTVTFTLLPKFASPAAARDAGIARLLTDIGDKLGHGREGTAQALNKFRIRMKLSADAGSADLFDALETEALKVAAPSGYSVCNDTDTPVWAALGLKSATAWSARGWWKVMPGACARAITAALSSDRIYLLVEDKSGRKLVSGGSKFCVTAITFEVEGRENCAARGLTEAGFAPTVTRGLKGFVAHVSENGLLPPPQAPD